MSDETSQSLVEALEHAIANDDAESVRVCVRDRLRRTEAWVKSAFKNRKMLAEAVIGLGKAGRLEEVIRFLDRADSDAIKRFARDNPDVRLRASRTADALRLFLAESGGPTAQRLFARAMRTRGMLDGAEAAAQAVAHLDAHQERAAAAVLERLIDAVSGTPDAEEVKALRASFDAFLGGLLDADKAHAFQRALARHDHETGRRLSGLTVYGLEAQLKDLQARYISDAVAVRWARSKGGDPKKAGPIVQELLKKLDAGQAEEALEVLNEEVLQSLDDRFGAPDAPSIALLDAVVAELEKKGALKRFIERAHEVDQTFHRANPHLIFVGAVQRLHAAAVRLGNQRTKSIVEKTVAEVVPADAEEAGAS